jgi:hypothetical protein
MWNGVCTRAGCRLRAGRVKGKESDEDRSIPIAFPGALAADMKAGRQGSPTHHYLFLLGRKRFAHTGQTDRRTVSWSCSRCSPAVLGVRVLRALETALCFSKGRCCIRLGHNWRLFCLFFCIGFGCRGDGSNSPQTTSTLVRRTPCLENTGLGYVLHLCSHYGAGKQYVTRPCHVAGPARETSQSGQYANCLSKTECPTEQICCPPNCSRPQANARKRWGIKIS